MTGSSKGTGVVSIGIRGIRSGGLAGGLGADTGGSERWGWSGTGQCQRDLAHFQ